MGWRGVEVDMWGGVDGRDGRDGRTGRRPFLGPASLRTDGPTQRTEIQASVLSVGPSVLKAGVPKNTSDEISIFLFSVV